MKIGIVGKGGVGKTTVSALLAQAYAERGGQVIAVDTDSNPNLGMSLGLSLAETEAVPVLPRSVIVGGDGVMTTESLLNEYGRATPAGVRLMSAIRVTEAGAGCTCGGHATLRSFLGETLAERAEVTVVDMEAGLEHLSRAGGTLAYADILLVVMEPSRKSVITAARTMSLAEELGIPRAYGLGNKARMPEDEEFFTQQCAEDGVPLIGVIPRDDAVVAADRAGTSLAPDSGADVRRAVDGVLTSLDGIFADAPEAHPAR